MLVRLEVISQVSIPLLLEAYRGTGCPDSLERRLVGLFLKDRKRSPVFEGPKEV